MYGAGHGGIEAALLAGSMMLNNLLVSVALNQDGLAGVEALMGTGPLSDAQIATLVPLVTAPADVLILPMTEDLSAAISLATLLRENGIRSQLHCEEKKFKQKIAYADKLGIPYVIFLGEDEISSGVVACKDMATGEQTKLEPAATVYRIKAGLAEREKGTVIQE